MNHFLILSSVSLFESLRNLIYYYPVFAFIALVMAGLNIPFSEDIIIIGGALIAQADDSLILPCIIAIYFGVAVSDSVSYFLGYFSARGVIKIKAVKSILSNRYTAKLQGNLDKHGFLTFIVCRFIPFGVRNTLFMSSGFFGLKYRRFLLFDIISSLISVNTLFWLVFIFGESAERPLHIAGLALLAVLVFLAAATIIRLIATTIKNGGAPLMITKYGLPQAAVFPSVLICGIAALAVFALPNPWAIPVMVFLFILLIWVLSFFRDPPRNVIPDSRVLYSPCDGTVTEVVSVGGVIRVSVFLSLFNVHINRAPCSATVRRVTYKKGQFRNAQDPESARVNESNEIEMAMKFSPMANTEEGVPAAGPAAGPALGAAAGPAAGPAVGAAVGPVTDPAVGAAVGPVADSPGEIVIVRQVSGAIARRIVCKTQEGDVLRQGEQFGMIKFGSRTELIVPDGPGRKVCVKTGDKVKAGLTVFISYSNGENQHEEKA